MKTIKQILETTYLPKGGDEKKFWDKHVRKLLDHPVAEPTQFKASTKKSTTNAANRDEASSESVYEAAFNDTAVHTKRADKEPVISRGIDPKTRKGINVVKKGAAGEIKIGEEVELEEGITSMSDARLKFHATKGVPHGSYTRKEIEAEHNRRKKTDGIAYASVKPSLNEEADLDEKVKNPYAIGMAAAMKQAGDTPPLKKSTIVKGHEIAKSIKKEALDPVGKADADIDNDGDVDKSDKYLHNRRKAISKALRKEETDLDEAKAGHNSMVMAKNLSILKNAIGKSSKESSEANHDKYKATTKNKEEFKEDVKDNADQNQNGYKASNTKKQPPKSQVVESVDDLDEAVEVSHDRYMRSHGKKASGGEGSWMFTHKRMGDVDYNNNKEVHTAPRGKFSDAKKSAQEWAKKHGHSTVYVMESVDQLDELSPNTLHSYIKKAAPDVISRTMSAVSPNQSSQVRKHASKLGNRIKGITSASGRLADKANADQYEEVQQIDEIGDTPAGRKALKAVIARAPEKAANARLRSDVLGRRQFDADVSSDHSERYGKAADKHYKKYQLAVKGAARAVDRLTKEEVEQIDEISTGLARSYIRKAAADNADRKEKVMKPFPLKDMAKNIAMHQKFKKREAGIETAGKKVYGIGGKAKVNTTEEVDLDEAFKAGQMKLKDGSSVTVSKDCAESLNSLFSQLNPANKSKMEERLMSSPKGYNEILSFAENING